MLRDDWHIVLLGNYGEFVGAIAVVVTLIYLTAQIRQNTNAPDSGWKEQLWVMQNIGQREAIREAWRMYRGSFDAPFQEFLKEQFRIGDSSQS